MTAAKPSIVRRLLSWTLFAFLVLLLTGLTQIGGLILILAAVIHYAFVPNPKTWKFSFVFMALYSGFTLVIVPPLAKTLGRVPAGSTAHLKPANLLTVVCNRNYVTPALKASLDQMAKNFSEANQGLHLTYLDANFPFMDGFPLPPHLSHNDGRKIDLGLIYEDANGIPSNDQKSSSGYGIFVAPEREEKNQPEVCHRQGYFQYSFSRYFSLGETNPELVFSESATRNLMDHILSDPAISKVFLEPHLVTRMRLADPRMRYHGCHAVRHDDHIHIQI